jgi:nitroreductase
MTDTPFDAHAHARQAALDAFRARRATKAFDPNRRIADDDVAFLLEVARLSPTSNGLEPFRIISLEDPAIRAELVQKAGGVAAQLIDASHLFLITAKKAPALQPTSDYLRHIKLDIQGFPPADLPAWQAGFQGFLTGRIGVWGNDRALFDWAARQGYIVLGNLMTAAALIGIDSVALEGLVYEAVDGILADVGAIDPDQEGFAVGVALGYRLFEPKRPSTRRPLDEIVQVL